MLFDTLLCSLPSHLIYTRKKWFYFSPSKMIHGFRIVNDKVAICLIYTWMACHSFENSQSQRCTSFRMYVTSHRSSTKQSNYTLFLLWHRNTTTTFTLRSNRSIRGSSQNNNNELYVHMIIIVTWLLYQMPVILRQ